MTAYARTHGSHETGGTPSDWVMPGTRGISLMIDQESAAALVGSGASIAMAWADCYSCGSMGMRPVGAVLQMPFTINTVAFGDQVGAYVAQGASIFPDMQIEVLSAALNLIGRQAAVGVEAPSPLSDPGAREVSPSSTRHRQTLWLGCTDRPR